jgi:hypothetical protein
MPYYFVKPKRSAQLVQGVVPQLGAHLVILA